jgi:hypothetical protein
MMNKTLVIIAIALIVAGIATIFVSRSDTTIPIPKPGNTSSSDNNSVTNSKYFHTNNNTGFKSSLNR